MGLLVGGSAAIRLTRVAGYELWVAGFWNAVFARTEIPLIVLIRADAVLKNENSRLVPR